MVKNIKRHQRLIKRDGADPELYNIIPTTYALPQDYALFVEVGRRGEGSGNASGNLV